MAMMTGTCVAMQKLPVVTTLPEQCCLCVAAGRGVVPVGFVSARGRRRRRCVWFRGGFARGRVLCRFCSDGRAWRADRTACRVVSAAGAVVGNNAVAVAVAPVAAAVVVGVVVIGDVAVAVVVVVGAVVVPARPADRRRRADGRPCRPPAAQHAAQLLLQVDALCGGERSPRQSQARAVAVRGGGARAVVTRAPRGVCAGRAALQRRRA